MVAVSSYPSCEGKIQVISVGEITLVVGCLVLSISTPGKVYTPLARVHLSPVRAPWSANFPFPPRLRSRLLHLQRARH